MISIVGCLFESKKEKDPTKIDEDTKMVGALGVGAAGGVGLSGHTLINQAKEAKNNIDKTYSDSIFNKLAKTAANEKIDLVEKIGQNMRDTGIAIGAGVSGGLAAHKLYKMYKNTRK